MANSEVSSILKDLLEKEIPKQEIPIKQEVKEEQTIFDKPLETKQEFKQIETQKEIKTEILEERNENLSKDVFEKINVFFNKNQIYVISKENVRKEKELNFIIDLPSSIGKLRYFVKFKNKKSIADKELVSASKEADSKNLPLIFLTAGNLTKKAEKYLHKNQSGKIIFYNLN